MELAEYQRKRQDLDRRHATLLAQQHELDAAAEQRLELASVADGIEAFCQTIRTGLATAAFVQRRQLAELLIDRVIATDGEVEIRYVLPTSPDGLHRPFASCGKTIAVVQLVPATLTRVASGTGVLRSSGRTPVPGCAGAGGSAASRNRAARLDNDPGPVILALSLRSRPGR